MGDDILCVYVDSNSTFINLSCEFAEFLKSTIQFKICTYTFVINKPFIS